MEIKLLKKPTESERAAEQRALDEIRNRGGLEEEDFELEYPRSERQLEPPLGETLESDKDRKGLLQTIFEEDIAIHESMQHGERGAEIDTSMNSGRVENLIPRTNFTSPYLLGGKDDKELEAVAEELTNTSCYNKAIIYDELVRLRDAEIQGKILNSTLVSRHEIVKAVSKVEAIKADALIASQNNAELAMRQAGVKFDQNSGRIGLRGSDGKWYDSGKDGGVAYIAAYRQADGERRAAIINHILGIRGTELALDIKTAQSFDSGRVFEMVAPIGVEPTAYKESGSMAIKPQLSIGVAIGYDIASEAYREIEAERSQDQHMGISM